VRVSILGLRTVRAMRRDPFEGTYGKYTART